MKVTKSDYDSIRSKIAAVPVSTLEHHSEQCRDNGRSETGFCWDIFHISGAGLLPEIRRANYNDLHLQTAIIKIIREILGCKF